MSESSPSLTESGEVKSEIGFCGSKNIGFTFEALKFPPCFLLTFPFTHYILVFCCRVLVRQAHGLVYMFLVLDLSALRDEVGARPCSNVYGLNG